MAEINIMDDGTPYPFASGTIDNGYKLNIMKHTPAQDILPCNKKVIDGSLPLIKEHQCYQNGHSFYLVCEIDNGRSKYGDHKCSRCGYVESFQYDYGFW